MRVRADTRVYALLGDPVEHSLSPVLQNAAFDASGVNGVYVALRCTAASVPHLVRALAFAGGGGNVTVPHKQHAVEALDVRSPAVDATGVCNTFWLEAGAVRGDNTDVEGFVTAARALIDTLNERNVLVVGAGGAARAAVFGLLGNGAARVTVLSRTEARARDLIARLDPDGTRVRTTSLPEAAREEYDLVVHATPLGLRDDDPMPLVLPALRRVGAVLDLVYRRGGTPLVHQAAAINIPARDGLDMLLAQGAAAFERWWKRPAPTDTMRAALDSAG